MCGTHKEKRWRHSANAKTLENIVWGVSTALKKNKSECGKDESDYSLNGHLNFLK